MNDFLDVQVQSWTDRDHLVKAITSVLDTVRGKWQKTLAGLIVGVAAMQFAPGISQATAADAVHILAGDLGNQAAELAPVFAGLQEIIQGIRGRTLAPPEGLQALASASVAAVQSNRALSPQEWATVLLSNSRPAT